MNFLLLAGIACLVTGVIGAGLTYRSMRTENLVHARTEELLVPFADSAVSASARFQPYTTGVYLVYLATGPGAGTAPGPATGVDPADAPGSPAAGGCTAESFARELNLLDGIIDISVTETGGRVLLARSIGPGDAAGLHHDANGWVLVDSVTIPAEQDSSWTLNLSYCPGTSFAPSCPWVVFLLPPQRYEIGGFLGDRLNLLLLFGGVMFAGFILIVVGGRKRP